MFFRNAQHQENFEKVLVIKPEMKNKEKIIIYLLTSIPVVAENLGEFYTIIPKGDYEGYIELDGIKKYSLSTGERMVVGVAFNLFNGFNIGEEITPYAIRSNVDKEVFKVYAEAIGMLA
jgi:hypothetical protein